MAILNTALGTGNAANIYASSGSSAITTIHLCNYTANNAYANIFLVPNGSTAGNGTIIYSNVSVTAYNTLIVYAEKFILSDGDTVKANCSAANTVTSTVSSIGI
jgi:hypothetical protein